MATQELLIRLGLDDSSFSKQMKVANKEFDILKHQLDATMKSFKNYEHTNEGLSQKIGKLGTMIHQTGERIEIATKAYDHYSQKMKEAEKSSEEFKGSLGKVQKELESKSKALESASKDTEKLAKEYAKLAEEEKKLSNLKNGLEKVSNAMKEQKGALWELENAYGTLGYKLEKNKEEYEKLYAENAKLKGEMLLSSKATEQYSKKFEENAQKMKKLEEENKSYIEGQKKLESQIKQEKKYLQDLENEYKKLQEELKRYKLTEVSLKDALVKTREELHKKDNELKNSQGNLSKLQNEVKQLKEAEESYQQQLNKQTKAMQNAYNQMQNYEREIAKLTKTQKELKLEMGQAKIDKQFLHLDNQAKKFNDYGNALSAVGGVAKDVGSTLTYGLSMPLVGFGTLAEKTFLGFEERIRKVNSVFGGSSKGMEAQFNRLSESSRKYGRETEWTAQQVGEAYEYMAMAGWDVDKSQEAMKGMLNLASIGMIDLGTATDIVTDTMTPFSAHLAKIGEEAKKNGKTFNDAEYMTDIFAQTIAKSNTNVQLMGETFKYSAGPMASYGVSMKDLAFATGIFANAGQKGSRSGMQLSTGLNKLVKPSKEAKGVMEKYGIEVKKTKDGSIDLMATMENMRAKLGTLDKAEKGRIMTTIFGQNAQRGWISILNTSAKDWENLKKAMQETDGVSDKMMDEISKSGAYQFKIMTSAIQDFLIVVGDALAPAIESIAHKITEMATKLSNWVSKMKETNPELLSLIGKLGLVAVALPPVIMLFGNFASGLGGMFSMLSKGMGAFKTLRLGALEVSEGISLAEGSTGILSRTLGGMISGISGATIAFTALGAGLAGLAIYIGDNGNMLSWLQDKWGTFGEVVGGICESLNGWFTLAFGNAWQLLKGLGKSIGALLTGDFNSIDDIWRETWADMENTTAKALSNIKGETTKGIALMRNASEEDLNQMQKDFDTVYEKIKGLTRDNFKDIAGELTEFTSGLNNDMLLMMRGASDSMAVLLDGINKGMNADQIRKQLESNLKGMATSGKYTADELAKDFEKAKELIVGNMKTGANRVGEEVTQISKSIGRLAQDGVDNVAINIQQTVDSMDKATFEALKNMGGTWAELFKGVEYGNKDMSTVIVENLKGMGTDTKAIIDKLNQEMKSSFENSSKGVQESATEATKNTQEAFGNMVETIKNSSGKGLDELSTIFANGLSTLDSQTILSLRSTSDQWYSILDGAVDSSGKLSDNLAQVILGNLNWISQNTPNGLEGLKSGLLDALVKSNLITQDQMEAIVKTVTEKTEEAKNNTEGTGEKVGENIAPKGAVEKTQEALDGVNSKIQEKTQGIVDSSTKAGEEAQKSFDQKVSDIGKDVKVDPNIVNVEAIKTQFGDAGTLAIQSFVEGWSKNVNLITEAIGISMQTVQTEFTAPMQIIQTQMDGLITKSTMLQEGMNGLKTVVEGVNSSNLASLIGSVDTLVAKVSGTTSLITALKGEIDKVSNSSVNGVISGMEGVDSKVKSLIASLQQAIREMQLFSSISLTASIGGFDKLKQRTDVGKTAIVNLRKELENLLNMSFYNFLFYLNDISVRIQNATNKSESLKVSLQNLNNISFYGLISHLSSVQSSLQSVINKAQSASSAVSSVHAPSLWDRVFGSSSKEKFASKKLELVIDPKSQFTNPQMTFGSYMPTVNNILSAERYANRIDLSKYQTSGSYYSSNSMVGTSRHSREINHQSQQLEILKEQNELLKQLLLATNNVGGNLNVNVELDGRQVAKGTARYMEAEMKTINKRKTRLGGNF